MVPLDSEARKKIIAWIAREILPHEASVRSWLLRATDPTTADDVIQESYCRIAGLRGVAHIRNGRAYFFATARSLVLQQLRHQRVVRIEALAEIDALDFAHEAPSPERVAAGRMELSHVLHLIEQLPKRCRDIMTLRKIHGLSQREVAERLGIPAHIVENDIAKGLRMVAGALAREGDRAERKLGRTCEPRRALDGRGDR